MILQFQFLSVNEIHAALQSDIDNLDHLAYQNAKPAEENAPTEWANPSWMVLGTLEGELVCQLCLLERQIMVGGQKIEVAGIGGVGTHPDWQRKGFARQLMEFTESIILDELRSTFTLLLCDGMPCTIYRKAGWKDMADYVIYQEKGVEYALKTNAMVLETADLPFPNGEINLCGLPW